MSKVVGVKPNKVVIKNLRNRWASISQNNEININVNLIKAPPEVIEYIIVHELCHLKINGHSYNFWSLLERYCPDYPKFIKCYMSMEKIYCPNCSYAELILLP